MRGITDESPARLWPGRRRWHPWVSFPSLKASPSVSPSPSLAWCWQLSPGESLDLVLDRHDGGVFNIVPLLGASCQRHGLVVPCCAPLVFAAARNRSRRCYVRSSR